MRKWIIGWSLIVTIVAVSALGAAEEDLRGGAPVPARIGYIPITDHLLLGVSSIRDAGRFRGVRIEPIRFGDMGSIAEGLRAGSLDGGFLFAPLAFQSKLRGIPIKIVLLGHRDGSGIVIKPDSSARTASDLRGSTIAIPHRFSTHNMLLHMFTARAGLTYGKDVHTMEVPPSEMPSALAGGSVDGYIVAEPMVSQGEVLGIGRVLVASHEIWEHHPDCVLVMREDFLVAQPDAARELVQSLMRSGAWVEANRREAAVIGQTFLRQPEKALIRALVDSMDRVTFANLVPVREELERMQNYMADELSLFPVKAEIAELLDTRFATDGRPE